MRLLDKRRQFVKITKMEIGQRILNIKCSDFLKHKFITRKQNKWTICFTVDMSYFRFFRKFSIINYIATESFQ